MIVLVGSSTKNLYKFVRWELEVAIKLNIPIIAVNLNGSNEDTELTPPILLKKAFFMNVPFDPKKVKFALDKFAPWYIQNLPTYVSSRHYDWETLNWN